MQDQNTDAADVDADDVAFEEAEGGLGDASEDAAGEGGDALGPRAQASPCAGGLAWPGRGGVGSWRGAVAGASASLASSICLPPLRRA